MKPRVFVGSSAQQAKLLGAISRGLEDIAAPHPDAGYFITRSSAGEAFHAKTSGIYLRADVDDLSTLDGDDGAARAALIQRRLEQWKSSLDA